jgi:chromosome segregation ATPase
MDLEKALQKISDLESEIAVLKKALTTQTSRTNNLDEKVNSFLSTSRDQKKELERIGNTVNNLSPFDATIAKMRIEFNKKVEETEKSIIADEKMRDNLRRDEIKAINLALEKNKQDILKDIDQKLKMQLDETTRLVQKYKEMESSVSQKIRGDEEMKGSLAGLASEFGQYKKKLESISADIEIYKKVQGEIREKQDAILTSMRNNDARIEEIVNSEAERKQTFLNYIEQNTINQRDRERMWKDWQQQFDESIQQIYRLLPELQNQQLELNKSKSAFDEITQRFERRINEITELYRMLDEKFRQEWNTYKTDSDKKWSNVSIAFEEKQGGISDQIDKIKERLLIVEDNTHEMQEVLILMSKEIQKGMQGLMNMVNGWMDAFGEIKSNR